MRFRVPLLSLPLRVLGGCDSATSSGELLPVCYGSGVGLCLGRVTGVYSVGHPLIFRTKQRACTARVALSRKIPLRAIDGVLKRDRVRAARVCTGIASSGVSISAEILGQGVSRHFSIIV